MNGNRKWEYQIESVSVTFGKWQLDKLNKMGEEGWEAISAFSGSEKAPIYILLKREKSEQVMVPPPPSPQPTAAQTCPTCGQPLAFIQQYSRWYCNNCKKYP